MKDDKEARRVDLMERAKANRAKMDAEETQNRALAKAWDAWITSEKGEQCLSYGAYGEFLRNRLWWAFMAGADSVRRS